MAGALVLVAAGVYIGTKMKAARVPTPNQSNSRINQTPGDQSLETFLQEHKLQDQLPFLKELGITDAVEDLLEIDEDMLTDLKPLPKKKLLKAIDKLRAEHATLRA